MNRRDFLFGASLVALTLSARAIVPPLLNRESETAEAIVAGRRFRGTRDGKILESLDGGETWHVIARFGDHCAVRSLVERGGQIHARLELQAHSFYLRSADARTWRTV